jgi:hypothetical protein
MVEGYEVDFLDTGDGSAIAFRYGRSGAHRVMIYDVTSRTAGEHVVEHFHRHYGTDRVDYLVCTHPDLGRIAGLAMVPEKLKVGQLWMHRPWEYCDAVFRYLLDPTMPAERLTARVRDKMDAAFRLYESAVLAGVRVHEPFLGAQIGAFHVMSPDREWYAISLLPNALGLPDWNGGATPDEDEMASAENESSVVLLGEIADRKILLTGSAGMRALTATANYADRFGVSLPHALTFMQIPHHCDRNILSPDILDRLIGSRSEHAPGKPLTAFVRAGCGPEPDSHKPVVEEFLRRGCAVKTTQRRSLRHYFKMPGRESWRPVEGLPFVEESEVPMPK